MKWQIYRKINSIYGIKSKYENRTEIISLLIVVRNYIIMLSKEIRIKIFKKY